MSEEESKKAKAANRFQICIGLMVNFLEIDFNEPIIVMALHKYAL